jgi:RNA polymerase sigma factor (sigma-70 family)
VTGDAGAEDRLRALAPQVLGVLMRRYAGLDSCEDAVQEALLAAATQWPATGLPDNPRAWLLTVATRRLADIARSESARREREDAVTLATPPAVLAGADAWLADAGTAGARDSDDTLTLLFLCCHPALTPSSQVALTLRAVGGLNTAEIARAFVVPEATMAQRISRAKQQIRAAGARFTPPDADRDQRLRAVQQVLYLIFNEGYVASAGAALQRTDLSAEGIRLARLLRRLLPDDAETAGLLALMLLTEARRPARTGPGGELVPLAEQDRDRWDRRLIVEGLGLIAGALRRGQVGEYQIQASIAALHDQAPGHDRTDWPQILTLYGLLESMTGNPMARLNRAVAAAMAQGPDAGLALLDGLDQRLGDHHRLHAVRAHLLEQAGDDAAAVAEFRAAADRTTNLRERQYLVTKAARLASAPGRS